MRRARVLRACVLLAAPLLAGIVATPSAFNPDTLITVGSPSAPVSQNKQDEPALAVDANHLNVLAAAANDRIDLEACNAGTDETCPFTAGVGLSGIYFSFDSGTTWTQPTYTGLTGRGCLGAPGPDDPPCTAAVGPIGTVPWYAENGLTSDGDPAVAFGPVPDANGRFAWSNGSRLYYANLTANISSVRTEKEFKGDEAVAVSRIDGAPALTPAIIANKNNWKQPVIVSKQSATLFSDKEQIWADNAASSPFFGSVYVCSVAFRSRSLATSYPSPVMVSISRDGGDTWRTRQISEAITNPQHGSRQGCTIRTDSHGVVYVVFAQFGPGMPGTGAHTLVKSLDGGKSWTPPQDMFAMTDDCFYVDTVTPSCVEDGVGGARNDLAAGPSVDIANGAPTGLDATNEIVDTWVDGRLGQNHEQIMLAYSTNEGRTWSAPKSIGTTGDRGFYSAAAISPDGTDLYVVYNAFTTPFRSTTVEPRTLFGVVLHADLAASGMPVGWFEMHRTPPGDARAATSQGGASEFLGDYVYAIATRTYGAAAWNDVRNALECPAIDAYRYSLRTGGAVPQPEQQQACPPTFGNGDVFGGSFPDPTP
jgi:hypothetical protein